MTKGEYIAELNKGNLITPDTPDQVQWFYEWLGSYNRDKLQIIAALQQYKEIAAKVFSQRIQLLQFLNENITEGSATVKVYYLDGNVSFIGDKSSLTIKL